MIINSNSERPEIKYPCEWVYRIIGKDVDKLISAAEESALNLQYEIIPSNVSSNRKYFSISLKVFVTSEAARDIIYEKLNRNPAVSMVL